MSDEHGFTIVELLVAMVISLVVIFAGFQALDSFTRVSATTQRRSDNTQRARLALDTLVRALRSSSCTAPGGSSMIAASATSISFATDLSDGVTGAPEQRTVSFDGTTRLLRESRYAGTRNGSSVSFAATPTTYGPELQDVEPADATTPIFRYFRYPATPTAGVAPQPSLELTSPVAAADLSTIAQVSVAFRVGAAAGKRDTRAAVVVQDQVIFRSVDPSDPVPLPLCQ